MARKNCDKFITPTVRVIGRLLFLSRCLKIVIYGFFSPRMSVELSCCKSLSYLGGKEKNSKSQPWSQAHSLPSFGDKVALCGLEMCVTAFVLQLPKLLKSLF